MLNDLLPRTILGTHPMQVLADKLGAVCWREGLVSTSGDEALNKMVEPIRDHYDICCLIRWLGANDMLDGDEFLGTVERTKQQERGLRERLGIARSERGRPAQGHDTWRVWTPGTQEHSTLSAVPQPAARGFGHLPSWDDVCDMVRSAQGVNGQWDRPSGVQQNRP